MIRDPHHHCANSSKGISKEIFGLFFWFIGQKEALSAKKLQPIKEIELRELPRGVAFYRALLFTVDDRQLSSYQDYRNPILLERLKGAPQRYQRY